MYCVICELIELMLNYSVSLIAFETVTLLIKYIVDNH